MDTTQSEGTLTGRGRHAARVVPAGVAFEQAPSSRELAFLESAHEQLLSQVQDLKRVYAAERERRARVARSTMDLATVLARGGAAAAFGSIGRVDSEAHGGA